MVSIHIRITEQSISNFDSNQIGYGQKDRLEVRDLRLEKNLQT